MTSETTLREKGRAVFLAALMVLSVVAMSAAFAGAAAADKHPNWDEDGVSYDLEDGDSTTDLGPVWIGQEVTLEDSNLDNYAGFEIRQGGEPDESSSGDVVADGSIDDGAIVFTADEDDFEEGFHHVNLIGSPDEEADQSDWDETVFRIESEELSAEFSSATVADDNQVDVTIESERDDQWLNVTAESVDKDDGETADIDGLFSDDDDAIDSVVTHDDENVVSIELTEVDDEATFEADFDATDIDVGEYEFEFDTTDSAASDTATIQVTDDDAAYDFVDVNGGEAVPQGEYAEITISVEYASEAGLVIGDTDDGWASSVELENIEDDDEVTLKLNTHTALHSADAWEIHDDDESGAEIVDDGTEVYGDHSDEVALPATSWSLTLGEAPVDTAEFEVASEHAFSQLTVDDRADIGDAATATAPSDDGVDTDASFDDYEDATVTDTDSIAEEDSLIVTVEDFGAEGAIQDATLGELGVELEIEEQDPGLFDEPYVWGTNADYDDVDEELEAELLNNDVDDYDGDLVIAVDTDGYGEEFLIDAGYDLTVTVTEDNKYVADEDEEIEQELELEFVDRELAWDDIESLPAAEDATATGTSTVAPGTNLDAMAESEDAGFVDYRSAVVEKGQTFAVDFDLDRAEDGDTVDLSVEEASTTVSSEALADPAELDDVAITADDEPEKDLDVSVDYESEITEGDATDFDVTVTNNKHSDINATLTLELDGEEWSEELEIDAESSGEHTFADIGADLDVGDHDFSITAESDDAEDTYEGTLSVEEKTDEENGTENGTDDENGEEDDDDDGTPGFGVAVAVVALLAAAMLALRRQN